MDSYFDSLKKRSRGDMEDGGGLADEEGRTGEKYLEGSPDEQQQSGEKYLKGSPVEELKTVEMNSSLVIESSDPQKHNTNLEKRSNIRNCGDKQDDMEDGGGLAAHDSPKDGMSNDEEMNKTKMYLEGTLNEEHKTGEKYFEGSPDEQQQAGEKCLKGSPDEEPKTVEMNSSLVIESPDPQKHNTNVVKKSYRDRFAAAGWVYPELDKYPEGMFDEELEKMLEYLNIYMDPVAYEKRFEEINNNPFSHGFA